MNTHNIEKLLISFLSLLPVLATAQNIDFACDRVKNMCITHWDANGDGELGFDEAAQVTSLSDYLSDNKTLICFDELQHFTGLAKIDSAAFFDDFHLRSVVIPPSVTTIGSRAFWSCISLEHVTIPPTVSRLEEACFYHCKSLADITVPGSVDTIPEQAFMWCEHLRDVSMGMGVRVLLSQAFAECEQLQYVSLPSTVEYIGEGAFQVPGSLRQLSVKAKVPPKATAGCFSRYVLGNTILIVPAESLQDYHQAPGWRDFRYITGNFDY